MVENVNDRVFNIYGVITDKFNDIGNKYFINESKVDIQKTDFLYYTSDFEVILDKIDGTALLCVSLSKNHEDIKYFLLDKTVTLKPNVYYNILPLYDTCKVRTAVFDNKKINIIKVPYEITPIGICPVFDLKKIFTLFYQEKEKGFNFNGEKHEFWELTYVDKGKLINSVDSNDIIVNEGEVIFYGKNQFHRQFSKPDESVCFLTISFDMNLKDNSLLINKKFKVDASMHDLLEKILLEKEQNSFFAQDIILCYLKEFIIRLIRNYKLELTIDSLETSIKCKFENAVIQKVFQYIELNLHKKITIADISSSVLMSSSYLSSIFKKHVKLTIVEYVNNLRLERSKDLIRTSDLNLTQIANKLGYTSVHYFSNQFKRRYGINPTSYAKSIKKS